MSKKKIEEEVKLTIETAVGEPEAQLDIQAEEQVPVLTEKKAKAQTLAKQVEPDKDLSLKEVIEKHGREDEKHVSGKLTFAKVLGGDILTAAAVRRQIGVVIVMTIFIIIYIANGYRYRKTILEIDQLTDSLKKVKIESMTSVGQLTQFTRKTRVIQMLRENGDTLLKSYNVAPIILNDVGNGNEEEVSAK